MERQYTTPDISVWELCKAAIICCSDINVDIEDLSNGGELPEENW